LPVERVDERADERADALSSGPPANDLGRSEALLAVRGRAVPALRDGKALLEATFFLCDVALLG
jgi:hypothetical protein